MIDTQTDRHTHTHTDAGNDNTEGQNWPRVKTVALQVVTMTARGATRNDIAVSQTVPVHKSQYRGVVYEYVLERM